MMYLPNELARHVAQMEAIIEADIRAVVDVILDQMLNPAEDIVILPDSDLPRAFVEAIAGWDTPSRAAILRPAQARTLRALAGGAYLMDRYLVDSDSQPLQLPLVRKDVRRKFIVNGWIKPGLLNGVKVFQIDDAGRTALANHDRSMVQFGR